LLEVLLELLLGLLEVLSELLEVLEVLVAGTTTELSSEAGAAPGTAA
jgi:hypothetical protein